MLCSLIFFLRTDIAVLYVYQLADHSPFRIIQSWEFSTPQLRLAPHGGIHIGCGCELESLCDQMAGNPLARSTATSSLFTCTGVTAAQFRRALQRDAESVRTGDGSEASWISVFDAWGRSAHESIVSPGQVHVLFGQPAASPPATPGCTFDSSRTAAEIMLPYRMDRSTESEPTERGVVCL